MCSFAHLERQRREEVRFEAPEAQGNLAAQAGEDRGRGHGDLDLRLYISFPLPRGGARGTSPVTFVTNRRLL